MIVSVIITIYNEETYLSESIDSVLAQTMTDFEVLLIDDGSTDASGAICDRYATQDQRIRVFHQPNGGLCAARNLGLDHAQGTFIVFVDADDWVDPNHLQRFTENSLGTQGVVFTGIVRHEINGGLSKYSFALQERHGEHCIEAINILRRHNSVGWVVSKMFAREIIERYSMRFLVGAIYREDELFTVEYCSHVTSIRIIDGITYHYRQLATGLTKKRKSPQEIIHMATALHDHYLQLGDNLENRYLSARIQLSQACEAMRAVTDEVGLAAAYTYAIASWKEYKREKRSSFLTDSRDRKVAQRSKWVFGVASSSPRLLCRLIKLINI
ncbi:MAG: glycosyltransferase family 2 protein [Alistipes sp.]